MTGRLIRSVWSEPASRGRSIRISAWVWMPPAFWGFTDDPYIGNYGDNSLAVFPSSTRTRSPGQPPVREGADGNQHRRAARGTLFDVLARRRAPRPSCRRFPGSSHRKRFRSTGIGRRTTAPGTSRRCSMRSRPTLKSGARRRPDRDCTTRTTASSITWCPPTPPRSPAEGRSTVDASNEIFPGSPGNPSGPYGLGVRVPTIVVSPWSKGGWVCSEVFDHTSLIRFIERRFGPSHPGLIETNITAWRRAVCGDLTPPSDFATPHVAPAALPDTAAYAPPDHLTAPGLRSSSTNGSGVAVAGTRASARARHPV